MTPGFQNVPGKMQNIRGRQGELNLLLHPGSFPLAREAGETSIGGGNEGEEEINHKDHREYKKQRPDPCLPFVLFVIFVVKPDDSGYRGIRRPGRSGPKPAPRTNRPHAATNQSPCRT